jgi:hypothetical protein
MDLLSPQPLRRDTQLVIEAAPSSANTFAVAAFNFAQPHRVPLAHHLHAPAQVSGAIRAGVPTLVIIRTPREVVVSDATRHGIGLVDALRDYLAFYRVVSANRPGLVLVSFDAVTTDFGSVTTLVNERFQTDFAAFEHTQVNVDHVFGVIEARYRQPGYTDDPARVMAIPTVARNETKNALHRALDRGAPAKLLEDAQMLYRTLLCGADA